ncbi:hypothetical protein [Aestuariimicrobium sp. T2.26MG-19.2B]|uniref:hypothetical protein n=1 Tax=Aestuariimicrobium sp. T2.26MG-19.2B TaxID=3040679 RepID=UPI0024775F85|nr:hypothetical protein [Aestuariimicrobium sp. T2.26MG-19.2B]CAI9411581.1 hypothetical protein AESSP_02680 [Aestuariimicrobium sp. T2.26MG-19.2B]
MPHRFSAALLAAAVGILTGCGTPPPPSTPAPTSAGTSTSPSPASDPTWSTSTVPAATSSAWDNPSADETSWPAPTSTTDPRSAHPTGTIGTARGMIHTTPPDTRDATQVARSFVATAWSYDTALDATPSDAGRRATSLATPDMAEALRTAGTRAQPGAWWTEMASHRGYTTTQLHEGGLGEGPSDSPTLAQRAITVTATPHGAGGWTGSPLPPVTLIVTCGRGSADQPWKVSAMRVIP